MLAGLMFSISSLNWESLDHVELFGGKAAVTTAELEAGTVGLGFRAPFKGHSIIGYVCHQPKCAAPLDKTNWPNFGS